MLPFYNMSFSHLRPFGAGAYESHDCVFEQSSVRLRFLQPAPKEPIFALSPPFLLCFSGECDTYSEPVNALVALACSARTKCKPNGKKRLRTHKAIRQPELLHIALMVLRISKHLQHLHMKGFKPCSG